MRFLKSAAIYLMICSFGLARPPAFSPTEEQISEHRAEVFSIARDYIVKTFKVQPVEEGQFNPVRFNSTGVWGDFRCRLKELGNDRFEVRGWVRSVGYQGAEVVWSVVLRYALVDPDGWKYRRLDVAFANEPDITSWRFGPYRSVPYEAEYSSDFLTSN